jgi:hypothetical protein
MEKWDENEGQPENRGMQIKREERKPSWAWGQCVLLMIPPPRGRIEHPFCHCNQSTSHAPEPVNASHIVSIQGNRERRKDRGKT